MVSLCGKLWRERGESWRREGFLKWQKAWCDREDGLRREDCSGLAGNWSSSAAQVWLSSCCNLRLWLACRIQERFGFLMLVCGPLGMHNLEQTRCTPWGVNMTKSSRNKRCDLSCNFVSRRMVVVERSGICGSKCMKDWLEWRWAGAVVRSGSSDLIGSECCPWLDDSVLLQLTLV
jgi:hypothetical protein